MQKPIQILELGLGCNIMAEGVLSRIQEQNPAINAQYSFASSSQMMLGRATKAIEPWQNACCCMLDITQDVVAQVQAGYSVPSQFCLISSGILY